MIRPAVLISIILVLVLVSAGCLTTPWEGDFGTVQGKNPDTAMESFSGSSAYPGGPALPLGTPAPVSSGDLAADQKIIRTASISLEVVNVTTALDQLKGIATANRGYTGSLSVATRSGDRLSAVLTMRIPAQAFETAIADSEKLGILMSESLSADDVTEDYVDLQAQRTALANQLAQYNRIMERAENVSEILNVQVQIERVQVELDRIDGRLKYLDNRVDYATITVSLVEPEPVGGGERFSFISVINEGISGFLAITAGLVIIIISIIPIIILAAIIYAIYRLWKQRKSRGEKPPEDKGKIREGKPPGS